MPTQLYAYKFHELPEIPRVNTINVEVEDGWETNNRVNTISIEIEDEWETIGTCKNVLRSLVIFVENFQERGRVIEVSIASKLARMCRVLGLRFRCQCQNYGPFLDPYYSTAPNI